MSYMPGPLSYAPACIPEQIFDSRLRLLRLRVHAGVGIGIRRSCFYRSISSWMFLEVCGGVQRLTPKAATARAARARKLAVHSTQNDPWATWSKE